jgi:WD40 repeat protein
MPRREIYLGKIYTDRCGGRIDTLAANRAGTVLANAVTDSYSIRIWDLTVLQFIHELRSDHRPNILSFDESGDRLVSVGETTFCVWELSSGILIETISCNSFEVYLYVYFTHDIIILGSVSRISKYDCSSGQIIGSICDCNCTGCSPCECMILR